MPETSTLTAVSQALGVSIFDLVLQAEPIDSVRFRARKSVLSECDRSIILIEVSRWLHEYAFLEEAAGAVSRLNRAPFAHLRSPEKLAVRFREVFGIDPTVPIYDPCSVLERTGIKVLFYEHRTPGMNRHNSPAETGSSKNPANVRCRGSRYGFSGLSVCDERCGEAIIVNGSRGISTEHKIFTAFHELGHLLMHLTDYNSDLKEEDPEEEAQADAFASFLLMPRGAFRSMWSATRGNPLLDRVFRTKQYFRVSYRTVLKRLADEKLAPENIWLTFAQTYKRVSGKNLQGYREPFALEPEMLNRYEFCDDRFTRLVFDAGIREKITVSKGAELLRIPVTEFRDRLWSDRGDRR